MKSCVFWDVDEFAHLNRGQGKWAALVEVLAQVSPTDPPHTRSRGDALTYRTGDPATWSGRAFVAHRLYRTVLMPVRGAVTVEIAPRGALTVTRTYSDLDDCEYLVGAGRTLLIEEGMVICVDTSEAWRVTGGEGTLLQARITVECPRLITPLDGTASDAGTVDTDPAGPATGTHPATTTEAGGHDEAQ